MVIDAIHKHQCRKVKDVVNILQQLDKTITLDEICDAINELKHENKITLAEPQAVGSFLNYITSLSRSTSFWLTIIVTGLTLATIYLTPQVAPWSIIRIIAGAVFVSFIPGYALIQLLFPVKDMDTMERIASSVGLSLAVTPLIGLLLNYSPWGIRLDPLVALLSVASIALAFSSTYRKFSILKENLPQ